MTHDGMLDDLRAAGPQPSTSFPNTNRTIRDRENGVCVFKPHVGLRPKPVYYIEGEHDPEDVLLVWADANQQVIEARPGRSVNTRISQYGDEWRDAAKEVLDLSLNTGDTKYDESNTTDCGLCGEENVRLREHLPDDCPEA